MKLILILLTISLSQAANFYRLSEKHWETFTWKTDAVLQRIDEKFEEDFKRAYVEYKNRDAFPEARRNAIMTRYEILDEIRARNKYAFLAPWSKHILTTQEVKYVPEEQINGDPVKQEEEYWEEVAKNHQENEEVEKYLFNVADYPSPVDLEEEEKQESCSVDLGIGENVGFDNDLASPYDGDMSEFSERHTVVTADNN